MKTRAQHRLTALALAALIMASPSIARAQCESPEMPAQAAAAATIAQEGAIAAMTAGIIGAVEMTTSVARAGIAAGLEVGWIALRDRLNQYWQDQQEAMQGQASQQVAGKLDQTRQLGSLADASVVSAAGRHLQELDYETQQRYATTTEGCRFDTAGPYMGRAMSVRRGIANAGVYEIGQDLGRREGRAAARGPAAETAERVERNRELFCNPQANGGNPGCAGDAGAFADAHVLPSRTLFGSDTYDISDARTLPAINELVRNLTGYQTASLTSAAAMGTAQQREGRITSREIETQMDANAGMLWGIAGERMPAGSAPEIEQMRMRLGGSQPSSSPSEYEIGQQVVEQLWDPAYYTNLQSGSAATMQKQIYLRAYSVMQLYKLIEKTERLATAYAIQTANMVDRRARRLGFMQGVSSTGAQTPGTGAAPGGRQ